ncbi:hypothetical protein L228DRAFT_152700 [Xylona heveae TC161]|uniref:Uncharacterized protein n=1 Tax=Xylona heveae (strain CBS 132557 / TC161) TaxID=1328760 RepID=A0A165GPA1_XYLHT|nr:hypothetical protein L228DRAFT_152700 [Xylona heveae TC161]KZF22429.1 hypothetical protein L228DRAFT_152700 [Xylona heveae TC161]
MTGHAAESANQTTFFHGCANSRPPLLGCLHWPLEPFRTASRSALSSRGELSLNSGDVPLPVSLLKQRFLYVCHYRNIPLRKSSCALSLSDTRHIPQKLSSFGVGVAEGSSLGFLYLGNPKRSNSSLQFSVVQVNARKACSMIPYTSFSCLINVASTPTPMGKLTALSHSCDDN